MQQIAKVVKSPKKYLEDIGVKDAKISHGKKLSLTSNYVKEEFDEFPNIYSGDSSEGPMPENSQSPQKGSDT